MQQQNGIGGAPQPQPQTGVPGGPQQPNSSALGSVRNGQGIRSLPLDAQQTQRITQGLDALLHHNSAPMFPGERLVGWQLRVLPNNQVGVEVFLQKL